MMIADTDVLIDFLRGREPFASRVALEIESGSLKTTSVTRFELQSGARTKREVELIGGLLAAIPTLPLDADSADRAAEARRSLERSGTPIGMADSLIAGIVLANAGTLLTGNRKHFERVPGLKLTLTKAER
jgi:tRNA(fMet)-specific endonuclease VapC